MRGAVCRFRGERGGGVANRPSERYPLLVRSKAGGDACHRHMYGFQLKRGLTAGGRMLIRGERVEAVLIGEDPATALAFGWKRQPGKQRQGASEAASSYGCAASAALRFRAGIRASVCCCLQPSVSFARQRTSAAASARHRGEKIYWSAQRPPKGVARSAAAAAVNGGEGTTEAARGWVGPGAPRGVALRLQSAGPGEVNRGCYRHAITLSPIYIKSRREEGKRRQRGRGGRETPKGSRRDTSGTLVSALSDK